jgi:hypothetical protein
VPAKTTYARTKRSRRLRSFGWELLGVVFVVRTGSWAGDVFLRRRKRTTLKSLLSCPKHTVPADCFFRNGLGHGIGVVVHPVGHIPAVLQAWPGIGAAKTDNLVGELFLNFRLEAGALFAVLLRTHLK